jgi:hypothetical protein
LRLWVGGRAVIRRGDRGRGVEGGVVIDHCAVVLDVLIANESVDEITE